MSGNELVGLRVGKALCKSIGNRRMDILGKKPGCLTSSIRDATVGKGRLSMFYNEYAVVQILLIPDTAAMLQKPAQEQPWMMGMCLSPAGICQKGLFNKQWGAGRQLVLVFGLTLLEL